MRRIDWPRSIAAGVVLCLIALSLSSLQQAAADNGPPTFSKVFDIDTIGPGSSTTLIFTIENTDSDLVDDMAFTDALPAELSIGSPAGVENTCGGIVSAPDGGDTISLTEGRLGSFETCTLSVNVTSDGTAGVHNNVTGDLTSSSGNSGTASDDLTVDSARPGFSKEFDPPSISFGAESTLTFTIDNTANASAVTGLEFIDQLPGDMAIASPANLTTDCTGSTGFGEPGTSTVSLGGGSVAAGASCTVSIDVTTTTNGTFDNISGQLFFGASDLLAGFATATLDVPFAPLSKVFLDDPVAAGSTVTLQFSVNNPSRTDGATGLTFTDSLPAGLSLISGPVPDPPCGAGSTLTGTTTLTFAGGTLPPEGTCVFDVVLDVPPGATPGTYINTTSALSGVVGGSPYVGNTATDDLTIAVFPLFTKEFTDDPVGPGSPVTLEFTITNTSPGAMTDLAFDDLLTETLPGLAANVLVDGQVDDPIPDVCGTGSELTVFNPPDIVIGTIIIVTPADPTILVMNGGALAAAGSPGDSCTFSVALDVPVGVAAGAYPNTTSELTGMAADASPITGLPATDDLLVGGSVTLSKEFLDDPVVPGDDVTLEFTISNPSDTESATAIGFTDDLTFLTGLAATLPPTPDPPCGAGSTLTGSLGDTLLTFAGGTLDPGSSCTFSISLGVPAAAALGEHTNTTSTVVATVGALETVGTEAVADLSVSPLTFTKEFTDDPVAPGDPVTLEYTIALDPASPTGATGITFRDPLDVTTPDLTTTGLPMTEACDPDGTGGTPGTGTLAVSGGDLFFSAGVLDPGDSCAFSVVLGVPAGVAPGSYGSATQAVDEESAGGIRATIDGGIVIGPKAQDILVVDAGLPPLLTKEFTDDPVLAGDDVTLRFTLLNPNTAGTLIDIGFGDALGDVLPGLETTDAVSNSCSGMAVSTFPTGLFEYAGAELDPGQSCEIELTVAVPAGAASGTFLNTTTAPAGDLGMTSLTGIPATDSLVVAAVLPTLSKSFPDDPVQPGRNVTLQFTIDNSTSTAGIADLGFSDDLDAVIPGLTAVGLPLEPCGTGSVLAGTSFLTLSGGSVDAGATCTFEVTLAVPTNATAGSHPNETSPLRASGVEVAPPATDDLIVVVKLCNGQVVTVDLSLGESPTSGPDVILGTLGPDVIFGLGGADTICGLSADDVINGGGGADTILGGLGNDTIGGQGGDDVIRAQAGDDMVFGGPGNDIIEGGSGTDDLRGQDGDDMIWGGNDVDQLFGGTGDDVMYTGGGGNLGTAMVVRGQDGDDMIFGGPDADDLDGGMGVDEIHGAGGADMLMGDFGDDRLFGESGNDELVGGPDADTLRGGGNDDVLLGGLGDDHLFGDEGLDHLDGQDGTDTCDGGGSFDTASGTCETIIGVP